MPKKTLSRIGITIAIVANTLLIIVAAAITIGFVALFTNAETKNLRNETEVASNVLQNAIQSKADETKVLAALLADDTKFNDAIANNDTAVLESIWNNVTKSNGIFGVFADKDGIIRYKSENCAISAARLFDAVSTEKSGMFTDDEAALFYRCSVRSESGMITVGYSYSDNAIVNDVQQQTGAHATIYCDNLRISTTLPGEDGLPAVGTTMLTNVYETVITNGTPLNDEVTMFGEAYMASYIPIVDTSGIVKGAFFTGLPMKTMFENRNTAIFIGVSIALVMVIISIFTLMIFISRKISRPITQVKKMAYEMEHGNLHADMEVENAGHNEISELAESISTAIMILDRYVGDISNMMSEMANGNFGYESDVVYAGDFVSIGESANTLRERMKDVIESINISADEVYSGSEQIANGASVLADGTTRQAAASQELSASLEDISHNISLNASNAEKAQALSNNSIDMVNKQNAEIGNMLAAMDNIENSAAEISKIIKAIEDIAFQTNILALNAAVEAARAGAAGKGFAVVADEVRNLANRSAEAVQNTSALIQTSIESVEKGTGLAERAAEKMSGVMDTAEKSAEHARHIAELTDRQTRAIESVRNQLEQIMITIRRNSQTSVESTDIARAVAREASRMDEIVKEFRSAENELL